MTKKFIFLFLLLGLFSLKISATHIVGGEIYYDYLGNDNYQITLKIYRDCNPGNAAYDDPAYVYIFDQSGNVVRTISIPLPPTTILPPVINNPCFTPPANVCVEEAIYQAIVNLPPSAGGYDVSYQRCCRNHSIVNIYNPGGVGSTYTAHIPGSSAGINNSPRYNNFPPIFVCLNVPLIFDHSATDLDGDSLYYDLCDPFLGADPSCPTVVPGGCGTPQPPPYDMVPWSGNYSANYPMSSSPALSIDHQTGKLTGTPNMLGQFVVGVCVSEYRNGVLLDVNKRDFQFNVTVCPNLPVASIPSQTDFCFGYQMNFTQTSLNATSYLWNFGDPTTTADESDQFAPSWTYPDSGTYLVTLVINPGSLCADTNTLLLHIQHKLETRFTPPPPQCAGNEFDFTAGGIYEGTGTFSWNFGDNASPSTSTAENPTDIVLNTAGSIPVTFTISEDGCTESYTDYVQVFPKPIADFGLASPVSCTVNPVQFLDSSICPTPLTYLWDLGNGSTSTLRNPVATYPDVGTYNVSLIVTSQYGCKDTVTLPASLAVLPPPIASFVSSPNCTDYQYNFSDISIGASTYLWNFGDPTTTLDVSSSGSPVWVYPDSGTYTVTLIINPGSSCTDTSIVTLYLPHFLDPKFTPPPAQCEGSRFNFNAGGSYYGTGTFSWNFGSSATPATSSAEDPTDIIFNTAGTIPVTFTVTENGCSLSYTDNITVYKKPVADFGLSSPLSCILNPIRFNDSSITDTPLNYNWNFGNGLTSTLQNPTTTYPSVGNYNVQLIVTSQHGCKDTLDSPASLNVLPPPVPAFSHSTTCFSNQINFIQNSVGAYTYTWNFGDLTTTGDASSLAAPLWVYSDSGTYTVIMTVNAGSSCQGADTNMIHVNPPLIPSYIAPPGECIDDNSFDFKPGGSYMGNGTFNWNFGSHANPSTSNIENPLQIVFDTVGTFPVAVTISENGCTTTVSGLVDVYPKPVAYYEITTTFGCALQPVYFIDDSQSGLPLTYLWNFGDGTSSTLKNPYCTYLNPGNYYTNLIITDSRTCKDTFDFPATLLIQPSPVAGFVVSPTYTSIFYPDISLADQSSGTDIWLINWGDNTITNNPNDIHTYTHEGTYTIMQIVQNNLGCYDTAYSEVLIDDNYLFWLPNAFTPGRADGINDVFKPKVIGVHKYSFMIFDRWGEKLFETNDLNEGWDGIYKNNLCQQDVYVYKISFWDDIYREHHQYIGSVTLVR
jgi:gliding motility-associated-like protein